MAGKKWWKITNIRACVALRSGNGKGLHRVVKLEAVLEAEPDRTVYVHMSADMADALAAELTMYAADVRRHTAGVNADRNPLT